MGNRNRLFSAFTLAEMMVVMLIMSIILAAMAPIMTTRIKSGRTASSSPWQWANNGVGPNAYFATNPLPKAIIGQNDALEEDNGRLIINTQNDYAHLLFKRDGNTLARFSIGNSDQPSFALNTSGSIGNGSVAFGSGALNNNTTGDYNTAIGYQALINEPSHSNNTAVGALTMANNNGSQNTAVGSGALQGNNDVANNTGSDNVAVGVNSLQNNKGGSKNVAVGMQALMDSNGWYNPAIGCEALSNNRGGAYYNTAIGYKALHNNNTGGWYNTAIGYEALSENTGGGYNTAIGYAALSKAGGGYNTAIGYEALSGAVAGETNTALGYQACKNVTSGSNVTCIGAGSGPISSSSYSMGSNIFVDPTKGNVVYIGTEDTTTFIPGNLVVGGWTALGANQKAVYMRETVDSGNRMRYFARTEGAGTLGEFYDSFGTPIDFGNGITVKSWSSDRRLKYVGAENKSGLDKIKQLKVFNYTFKKDEKKTPHVGVIAQDLQKVFPNAVTKGQDGFLRIRMEDMFYAVVNAVKELDAKINVILSETKDLKKQVTEILRSAQNDKKQITEILKQVQNDNKQLKKENAELKARLDRLEQKLK